ncbi:MAG: MerR family transcriptional regulator, partial [Thermoguttaceae bacterium]|nr:MerR family transcriptional regulator [Thermoguttaceae bacterium]
MESSANDQVSQVLRGKRVAFLGRLASMSKREAAQLVRRHGATVLDAPDPSTDLLVLGEQDLPLPREADPEAWLDAATRRAVEQGTIEVIPETRLWERLGFVEPQRDIHRLYTPAMLADLLGVPVAVIRRWHRRGLIVPVREVRRLPYFDFQEVATARRLAELLATGMKPATIEKKLAALSRWLPGVERPLAQLSVIVRGRKILLRQGDGLIEPGGQLQFDFEAADEGARAVGPEPGDARTNALQALAGPRRDHAPIMSPGELAGAAAALEDEGQLEAAAEMYRAAMAAGGPTPELCFQLAEVLYRLGELGAARERYYMAIECDEDYVEARANLGCVLAEMGERGDGQVAFS